MAAPVLQTGAIMVFQAVLLLGVSILRSLLYIYIFNYAVTQRPLALTLTNVAVGDLLTDMARYAGREYCARVP